MASWNIGGLDALSVRVELTAEGVRDDRHPDEVVVGMTFGRVLAGLVLLSLVLVSPLVGLAGVAAWQHYQPTSLRVFMREVTAFTESVYDHPG